MSQGRHKSKEKSVRSSNPCGGFVQFSASTVSVGRIRGPVQGPWAGTPGDPTLRPTSPETTGDSDTQSGTGLPPTEGYGASRHVLVRPEDPITRGPNLKSPFFESPPHRNRPSGLKTLHNETGHPIAKPPSPRPTAYVLLLSVHQGPD